MEVKNKLDNTSKKVELIPAKGLTKYLIKKYSILNGGKYFGENELQNY